MMTVISKGERLLNLVSFLLKSRVPVGLDEIRKSVLGYKDAGAAGGVVERRFERDKAALREMGVPLRFVADTEPGGPGYVIPRDAYFLPPVELNARESAVLAAAGRFALAGAAGPVSAALHSAIRKLQFDSAVPGGVRDTAEEHFLFHRPAAARRQDTDALGDLAAAILNRRAVRFSYRAIGKDAPGRRAVDPYGLGFSNGHWYLVGYDHDRRDVRLFRADRIDDAVVRLRPESTRPEFDTPADFRVEDYVGVPPWLFGKSRRATVRVRIDAEVAFIVRMRPAPGDQWQDEAGGGGILTRRATQLDSLLNWVLGLGRHAEVLDPPEFRRRVIDTLREIERRHAAAPGPEGAP
jgi:predicted DNA-binding transcriptional regulator YafY